MDTAIACLAVCCATSVFADEIELDWNSVELGFFEKTNDSGDLLHGLTVYVPSNRVAVEDDFYAVFPEFCDRRLDDILEISTRMEEAPEVSLLKLQLDFYGPKVGENETYVGVSATIELEDGECSL
ncbi:hypothetical protein [uncultured Sulfitobacter sp.]|uniref:hypothetical protein n=1 Tax=uncultured Sulfitobacter sp. TaxID=191468 RepID=UPI00262A5079|nr:hypothetical protein [uncultured Sulfitobacter sp.]